jgi:hypothetical protein
MIEPRIVLMQNSFRHTGRPGHSFQQKNSIHINLNPLQRPKSLATPHLVELV